MFHTNVTSPLDFQIKDQAAPEFCAPCDIISSMPMGNLKNMLTHPFSDQTEGLTSFLMTFYNATGTRQKSLTSEKPALVCGDSSLRFYIQFGRAALSLTLLYYYSLSHSTVADKK